MKKLSRRSFLGRAAAAAGAATVAPWVWIPRSAFAATTPAFGAAKRLLVLYAGGGLRSQPLFAADAAFQFNPFGKAATQAAGTQWTVGSILGTQQVQLNSFPTPVTLPPVNEISNDIAVIAGVDHDPFGAPGSTPTDHGSGDLGLTTGDRTGMVGRGLLSILHRDLPGYAAGTVHLPPFDVGLSNFAMGTGDFAAFKPIGLQSASQFTGASSGTEQLAQAAWAVALRDRKDTRRLATRAPTALPQLTSAHDAKLNSRIFSALLHDPTIDLLGAPDATKGGVTNQQVLETLGGGQFGGTQSAWALEVAFAFRLLQNGVPAVSVKQYLYDDHSSEKTQLPIDAADLGRQIAGLHFLLKNATDDAGAPLWNSTVVLVVSEFSRDDADPTTGFNSADGSDHQGTPAQRNQVWPVFGGPVTGGKLVGGLDPATQKMAGGGPAFAIRGVLATMLDVMGIPSAPYFPEAPIAALFT